MIAESPSTAVCIPFNRPSTVGKELEYMAEALASGHISGDGIFTARCQRLLEEELGVPKVLLTTSCTHALELTALLLEFQPGDEVVVPSYSFVTTANAFVLHGARPLFADVRPDTLNLDPEHLDRLITPRTRAVVVVHYAGVACAMDEIMEICRRRGVVLIEDNAHGLFGRYRGHHLGTLGTFGTQSFHETKNFSCGEGGALLINDPDFSARAEILREKGTDRSRFFRGEVDKYSWVDVGSSYPCSDLLAAYLYAQLEERGRIQRRRCHIWQTYQRSLTEWAQSRGVSLPVVPEDCEQVYHMFYLLMPSPEVRASMIDHLKDRGILSVFHYQPLHLSEMGRRFGGRAGDCPVTEQAADRLLRLPFFNSLAESQQAHIIEAVLDF